MGSFPMQEDLKVTFQLLSGENESIKVPRDITDWELHQAATSIFSTDDLKLFLSCTPLGKDCHQPLIAVQHSEVQINTVLAGSALGGTLVDSFIDLMRAGRFGMASTVLRRVSKVAVLQDSSDHTALAWAAYFSKRSIQSFDLICQLLNRAGHHARKPCRGMGFLPLHEAAWGNAPTAVAVLLCAAWPSAVYARARDGSLPHDIGKYYHGDFGWPFAQKLLELADKLRVHLQHVRSLSALRRTSTANKFVKLQHRLLEGAVVDCLRLPHGIAKRVTDFVESPVLEDLVRHPLSTQTGNDALNPNGDANAALGTLKVQNQSMPAQKPQKLLPGFHAAARPAGLKRPRPPRGRFLRGSNFVQQTDLESVEHTRETYIKERGQLAGFHRVRNRKCSFRSVTEVTVSSIVHRLMAHTVHAVQEKYTQTRAVWPEKTQLFKDRARERDAKYEDKFSTSWIM